MNKVGGLKQHSPINPMGVSDKGGEYKADKLEMNCGTVKVPAGENPRSAMVDGPFGGKVKA